MATTLAPDPAPVAPRSDPPRRLDGPGREAGRPAGRLRGLVTGRPDDPRWVRPALLALLAATALLYLWGLGASGWANSFYSAAVQAGTKSWKAFFFGSSDASNFITVDKPPASLWIMEVSARVFGVNAWSILVPQALEGVAAVGLLYATVRRWFTPAAALLAGAVLALTPVATLMFRFNNPDALLVLLLTGGAYATVRAIESGRTRWLVLAGALVGTGFITKMMQAFVVLPAFALVYLLAGPPKLGRRIGQLVAMGASVLVSAGWWVAVVALVPARARPYVGGSQGNSILNLIFGYNGFGRITGSETGSVGGGGGATSRWGPTGLTRLFTSDWGGQIAWLLPAALILLVAGLAVSARARRQDRTRAALLLWGGWLVVTGLVFSLAQGIIHPYYAVALAPAIGAVVGIGSTLVWSHRVQWWARATLAATVAVTAWWSAALLDRSPTFLPWLRPLVLVVGFAVAAGLLWLPRGWKRAGAALAGAALVVGLAGPAAYSLDTAATAHHGAIPSAGPAVVSTAMGGPGGGPAGAGGFAGPPGAAAGFGRGTGFGGTGAGTARTGGGGFLEATTPSATLVATLKAGASHYTWAAATVDSNSAAGYQLASDEPVMAIGGFNGTDPAPTLTQFEQYVSAGKIHYFIVGGSAGLGGPGGGTSGSTGTTSSQITSWVESHFTARTVGGTTIYDLTASTT